MPYVIIFILGSIIGSFLNVCIYRMPRNESIIFPRSRCISCKKTIPWYDNIPLLSYVFLKARCRFCNVRISSRYFVVEFISALSFLILFMNFGFTYRFWIYSLLTFSLIVASFIDIDFEVIPDTISIGGLALGIVVSGFIPRIHNMETPKAALIDSLLGILTGAGLMYLTGVLGKIVFRKEAMGGGDVKLMAMLGAFLGWKQAIVIFFLAPFFGTPSGIYSKFKNKRDVSPYGPYISMAGFMVMIWGKRILDMLFL